MNIDEKQQFANDAEQAIIHPLVQDVIDELLLNLNSPRDTLVSYGIHKVANTVAQVARAQALGIDPEILHVTPDEANDLMMRCVEALASEEQG